MSGRLPLDSPPAASLAFGFLSSAQPVPTCPSAFRFPNHVAIFFSPTFFVPVLFIIILVLFIIVLVLFIVV